MNRPEDYSLNSKDTAQDKLSSGSQFQLWLALAFVILQFLVLEGIAIVRLVRSDGSMTRPDLLHHIVAEMFAPLMIFLLGIFAYRKIEQAVPSASVDPAFLRAVALYGSFVLGFAFLTMDLLL
jgi:cation transport ATPase